MSTKRPRPAASRTLNRPPPAAAFLSDNRAPSRDSMETRPPNAQIITDEYGRIVEVSENTARVLNLSARGAQGRPLPLFVEQDRPGLLRQLEAAARGHAVVLETVLRPLGRRARRAVLRISRLEGAGASVELQWQIELL